MDKEQLQKNIIGGIIQFDCLSQVFFLKPQNFDGIYRQMFEIMRKMDRHIDSHTLLQKMRDEGINGAAWHIADCMTKVNDWIHIRMWGFMLIEDSIRKVAIDKVSKVTGNKKGLHDYTAMMDVLEEISNPENDLLKTILGAKNYFTQMNIPKGVKVVDDIIKNIDLRVLEIKSEERIKHIKNELKEAELVHNEIISITK